MERRKFTREFKLEAVRLIKERGVSCRMPDQGKVLWPVARNGVSQSVVAFMETSCVLENLERVESNFARLPSCHD
jgi:hypothetical protein